MRIVELPPSDLDSSRTQPRQRRVYRTKENSAPYQGPPTNFPYASLRALGITQLVLGACICGVGLIQLTLSKEDRAISLVSGAVILWCPLFAIAAGVIGMLFSRHRYWDIECMKVGFAVTSSLAALMMLVMMALVVVVQFYYYDIHNMEPEEDFLWFDRRDVSGEDMDNYKALVVIVVVLGGIEFLIAAISALVCCIFAETYEPDSRVKRQYVKPQSQLDLLDHPPPQQPPPPQMAEPEPQMFMPQPQPIHIMQPPPQFMQPAPQFMQPTPIHFMDTASIVTPPPSLVYVA